LRNSFDLTSPLERPGEVLSRRYFYIILNYSYKTYFKDVPGAGSIAYVDEGKGEHTLLFIHGLANYAMVWQKNIEYLKQYYRCIAIDLPGNGLSGKEPHEFGMKFYADAVYGFIQALGLKDLTVVGHSMGGQVAMTMVLNHLHSADKLVLCSTAGFEEFSSFEKSLFYGSIHLRDLMSSDESLLRHTIENSFYKQHKQGEGVVKELVDIMKSYKSGYYRKMVEASIKGMLEEPVIELVQLIKVPTLIVYGKEDALIPNKLLHHLTTEKVAQHGAKRMSNAKLLMLPDCGHFLQWEKPDELNREIIMFVQ
jgi:pimeloyl-ACP methyl ester carboxylesterase